jgi:hypothetical protein
MKKQSRKLNLNRETIIPLQSDELAIINGGFAPLTSQLTPSLPTRFLCPSLPSLPSVRTTVMPNK